MTAAHSLFILIVKGPVDYCLPVLVWFVPEPCLGLQTRLPFCSGKKSPDIRGKIFEQYGISIDISILC